MIDSSGKQSYLETWQNQGFPPINCRDLSAELWVSDFPQNCEGAWSDFGPCSTSCGCGTRSRRFQIMRPAQNGDCTAGLTEDMTDAAAACEKNNLVAVKIKEMSPVLEQVQDDCGLIVPFFREVVNSLKWDLNALFKHACSGNAESGETTLSLLDEHIKGLLEQMRSAELIPKL